MSAPWDENFEEILRPLVPLHPADAALPAELDLVGAGLDSLNVVELLFQVEEAYDIHLADEEVGQHVFATPAALWATITKLRAAEDTPPAPRT